MTGKIAKIASGALVISSILLATVIGMLFPYADSGRDLVKLRNALLFGVADAASFEWQPDAAPNGFLWEEVAAPSPLQKISTGVIADPNESEFLKSVRLARHLVSAAERTGDAVKGYIEPTYKAIVEKGEGYCADYTLVFTALALAAEIPVREWGMSFDGFGGDGHAFSEIYDRQMNKWIFIDSFYSFYVETADGEPLSVAEFRGYLRNDDLTSLRVVPIDPAAFMFPSFEYALNYYARGADSLFMIWGNNVFTYDRHPAVRTVAWISRAAEQSVGILFGIQPDVMILKTPTNLDEIAALQRLKWELLAALIFAIIAMTAVFVLVGLRIRASSSKKSIPSCSTRVRLGGSS